MHSDSQNPLFRYRQSQTNLGAPTRSSTQNLATITCSVACATATLNFSIAPATLTCSIAPATLTCSIAPAMLTCSQSGCYNQKVIPQKPFCNFFPLLLRVWEQYFILHLQCCKMLGAGHSQEYRWIVLWDGGRGEDRLTPGTGEVKHWPIAQLHKKVTSGWHAHPVIDSTRSLEPSRNLIKLEYLCKVHSEFPFSIGLNVKYLANLIFSIGGISQGKYFFFFQLSLLLFFHLKLGLLGLEIFKARRIFRCFERPWVTEYQQVIQKLPLGVQLSLCVSLYPMVSCFEWLPQGGMLYCNILIGLDISAILIAFWLGSTLFLIRDDSAYDSRLAFPVAGSIRVWDHSILNQFSGFSTCQQQGVRYLRNNNSCFKVTSNFFEMLRSCCFEYLQGAILEG
ncbi:hypothetical protein VP01_4274g1 [Puccinia sorghi]|uniref:Uncharacterized protein n=1 Tax=Puccinia sorghi TaxID=27349 RepID=A0A0L6UQA5_9BASI|nr:hypothetical protein VP01_4274g1 [Puccinia sorghi]